MTLMRRPMFFRLHVPVLLLALCATPVLGVDGLDDVGGYSSTPFDLDFAAADYALACAAQPDGKVLLAGSASDDDGEGVKIAVARLKVDGLLDSTFDGDGRVVLSLLEHGVQATNGRVRAIAVDAQGRILIAGSMDLISNGEAIGFVTRLLPDGWLDPVFPPAGWYLDFNMRGVVAMGFDANGYLWLVGSSALDGSGPWVVSVLDQYGDFVATDTVSFASWGFATTAPTAFAFQPDGKVLLGGWGTRGAPTFWTSFALTRFLALTILADSGFNGGQVVLDYAEPARLRSIALQPDGGIVVAGEIGPAASEALAITRLSSSGSVSGGFTEYVNFDLPPGSDGGSGFNRMVVQSDGKVVVAASVATGDPTNITDVGVARILATGGLDGSFGGAGSGKRTFDMPPAGSADGNDTLTCLTLSGGKPVVVGSGRYSGLDWDFSFRRLTSDLAFRDGFESGSTYYWSMP